MQSLRLDESLWAPGHHGHGGSTTTSTRRPRIKSEPGTNDVDGSDNEQEQEDNEEEESSLGLPPLPRGRGAAGAARRGRGPTTKSGTTRARGKSSSTTTSGTSSAAQSGFENQQEESSGTAPAAPKARKSRSKAATAAADDDEEEGDEGAGGRDQGSSKVRYSARATCGVKPGMLGSVWVQGDDDRHSSSSGILTHVTKGTYTSHTSDKSLVAHDRTLASISAAQHAQPVMVNVYKFTASASLWSGHYAAHPLVSLHAQHTHVVVGVLFVLQGARGGTKAPAVPPSSRPSRKAAQEARSRSAAMMLSERDVDMGGVTIKEEPESD
jgi:hypothetical protein